MSYPLNHHDPHPRGPGYRAGPGGDIAATRPRRRLWWVLAGAGLVVLAVLGLVVAVPAASTSTTPPDPSAPPGVAPGPAPDLEAGGWDVAAQTALATRAMIAFPDTATQRHELASDSAGPPIPLPRPTKTAGRLVPGGFPGTPAGALAQLAELTRVGLSGGDPQTYANTYRSVSLPGAPDPGSTSLYRELQQFRSHAGLPASGGLAGFQIGWTPTSGLVKGTTDGGRYAVVCVLGEFTVETQGRFVSGGFGDCQALRYVDGEWRISPGALAATAPSAWPGTAEAVAAGYRELT